MNGKGDTRRPQQVSDDVLKENWERCFGNPFIKLARWQAERDESTTGLEQIMFGVPPNKTPEKEVPT